MLQNRVPFHAGEIKAQDNAGVSKQAADASRFIRDFMPVQHREFFAALPFLVLAGADASGRRWVTLLETDDGYVASPDPRVLRLPGRLPAGDPLASGFVPEAAVGLLGIELATRRRNRVNGRLRSDAGGVLLEVVQSFGNCPQYISERDLVRIGEKPHQSGSVLESSCLSDSQKSWITGSDTFFIGSGLDDGSEEGFDASHRGGAPGFVEIEGRTVLRIPDYRGNNFFNTIGNLVRDPRIGLLFIDFEDGGLLHLTGRAQIIWDGKGSRDPEARREILVSIEHVVERQRVIALRWQSGGQAGWRLRIAEKVVETPEITSFYFEAADGGSLPSFLPGQHLPVAIDVPGHSDTVRRSYSLSGPVSDLVYRVSVKREPKGLVSGFLHDQLGVGDIVEARTPAGSFLPPEGEAPLVLVSAGVGVTPMLAMLHAEVGSRSNRRIWFVHGVRNSAAHVFRNEVEDLAARAKTVVARTFYSSPRPEDRPLPGNIAEGRMNAADLVALGAGPEATYMICGPAGFITGLTAGLERLGVRPDRIVYESFGPSES